MPYEVKLEELTAQPIASMRNQVAPADISSVMGEAFQRVFAHVGRVGGIPAGPPLAAYHSFDEQSIDVEIGGADRGSDPGGPRIRRTRDAPGAQL